eukprot:TRINITY_DN65988_c0_g1_i1.p1 TRINITY_DN65988_c0_g1~~TRINITY_DN65988_c0_g1_i1.p1  ORF type:complete len:119 (+),score=26.32 TRINITY_DN65988_c0_g1_i1:110-466(+)
MRISVKCTSGTYDLEADKGELVGDLVRRAREKHTRPSWANGVQLKIEGQSEDLVATCERKTLQEAGIFDGTHLRLEYYKQISPEEARNLRLNGIHPGSEKAFLMPKDVDVKGIPGVAG